MKQTYKINIKHLLVLAFLIRLFLIPFGMHSDLHVFSVWAKYATDFNLRGYYDWLNFFGENPPIQPPLTIYWLALANICYRAFFYVLSQVNFAIPAFPSGIIIWLDSYGLGAFIKLFHIIPDVVNGFLVYVIARKLKIGSNHSLTASALYLLNPLTVYNSAIWGQNDAFLNMFFIASLLAIVTSRYILVLPLFVMSCMTKASLAIFAPLYLVWVFRSKIKISTITISLLISAGIIYYLSLPFAIKSVPLWLYDIFTKRILQGEIHDITANAFNLWALLFGFSPIKDSLQIFSFTNAQTFGNMCMALFTLLISYSLFRKFSTNRLLWASILLTFSSFLFMTRMHERYLFPIFAPLALLVCQNELSRAKYYLVSFIHIVNLYHLWWFPRIGLLVNIFSFTPLINTLILFLYYFFFSSLISFLNPTKATVSSKSGHK